MISSVPSSPEQRRRRRKLTCNDNFHRIQRIRKITEIYQLSSKKLEEEEETDIASTAIKSDSDSIRKLLSDLNSNKNNDDDGYGEYFDFDGEIQEMDDTMLEEVKEGQPSEFNIMKELLGISIFTYILAGLIVFFLGMNYILGPGWLGSTVGIPGTGSFDEVSPSIPGMIDLNKPEFRL
ncbi:hypothetical protein FRACYDRAFT_240110 [Fragilariopsis cylindrus CCMP1102]|uniref:Uncharacterized protein n=1 Tax=Fragilariopsis cylindrus CCMP1102 TaxID=635003 RepID=A0A1E7FC83_9STRA|nr:hypothetical protein FRACYDRAFT_240110 [Fragilariopsis cylindrus CCMP1102]|eukprot:OEU15423.1 hypothetical protein FRACYDRAFT_240110 [Fragilariopsis cylindrus CCMP1102]